MAKMSASAQRYYIITMQQCHSLVWCRWLLAKKIIQKNKFHSLPYQLRSAAMLSVAVHIHQKISL